MPLINPEAFEAVSAYLAAKKNLPVNLSAEDIAIQLPASIRNRAFFSANVAKSEALVALRDAVERVARGEINVAAARAGLKLTLADQGWGWLDPADADDRDVSILPSTRRLDLVIRQNVAMAHAVGQRAVAELDAVIEALPNYKYYANTDRHARFDGLILPKRDPFWNTYFPPIDFNCLCEAIDEPGEPNAVSQITGGTGRVAMRDGTVIPATPNDSGYEFRSRPDDAFAEPDFSLISDPIFRERVRAALEVGE